MAGAAAGSGMGADQVPQPDSGDRAPGVAHEQPWPLWEVFVQPRRGLGHVHVGSLHAADPAMALQNARDVYTRRGEGESIWVVPSAQIVASSPSEKGPLFDPALDKAYRHPTFYEVPEGVSNM